MDSKPQNFRRELEQKSLNNLLDLLEVDISKIGQGDPHRSLRILMTMDRVDEMIANMKTNALPAKAEAAQLGYLISSLEKNSRAFVKDSGGSERMAALRKEFLPAKENRWWYIDEYLNLQRRRNAKTILLTCAGVILLGIILVVIYKNFLAPDPSIAKSYRHEVQADHYIQKQDFEKAAIEINQALSFSPGDASLLILRGVLEEKLGQAGQASVDYQQAETKLNARQDFLLLRSGAWLKLNEAQSAIADAQEVIQSNPSSAQAYYYLGRAFEMENRYQAAIETYDKASQLAGDQGQTELNATIRVSMAMLMQSMPVELPTANPTVSH